MIICSCWTLVLARPAAASTPPPRRLFVVISPRGRARGTTTTHLRGRPRGELISIPRGGFTAAGLRSHSPLRRSSLATQPLGRLRGTPISLATPQVATAVPCPTQRHPPTDVRAGRLSPQRRASALPPCPSPSLVRGNTHTRPSARDAYLFGRPAAASTPPPHCLSVVTYPHSRPCGATIAAAAPQPT